MSLALRVLATLAALLWAAVVRSEVITVASPFPKELLMVYKRAIEEQYPGLRVQYVHFPATNAVSFLQDRAPGTRPDTCSTPRNQPGGRKRRCAPAVQCSVTP